MSLYDPNLNSIDREHICEELLDMIHFVSSSYDDCTSDKPEQKPDQDFICLGDQLCKLLSDVGCTEIPIVTWPSD